MSRDDRLVKWCKAFPWDSEEQREGFLNLVQYLRRIDPQHRVGEALTISPSALAAYFIQKNHESADWFLEHLCKVTRALEDRIVALEQANSIMRIKLARARRRPC